MFCMFVLILIVVDAANSSMEAFVLGGNETTIEGFPHSVLLNILCKDAFICGGSILNQMVVLTAGHCFEECLTRTIKRDVLVKYGHGNIDYMTATFIKHFIIHEDYKDDIMENDIALVMTKYPIMLGQGAKRIVLLQSPPWHRTAYMAGWGSINKHFDLPQFLQSTVQEIQPLDLCEGILGKLPPGTFCAGPINGPGAAYQGDSGSALVVDGYVQIGIVSYNVEHFTVMAYTNVSYHYSWIERNSARIACRDKNKNKIKNLY